jgi:hypothetical protein
MRRSHSPQVISPRLVVTALYDEGDGWVITLVQAAVGDRMPIASLTCLYVAAGLGPAQHIRDIARTARLLPSVLATHADALTRLLPVLATDRRPALLLECNGQ